MKTRNKATVRNIAEPDNSPLREFLSVMKTLFDESAEVLKSHRIYYRHLRAMFDDITTEHQNFEKRSLMVESLRQPYQISQTLSAALTKAQDEVATSSAAVNEIRTDAIKRQWEEQIIKLSATLHLVQMKVFNNQRHHDIETHKRLRAAEKQLDLFQKHADNLGTGCLSSGKRELANEKITAQEMVVAQLESKLNEPIVSTELSDLQDQLAALHEKIKNYAANRAGMLSAATQKLKAARQQLKIQESELSREKAHYYTYLDAVSMRGLLRLYDNLTTYKTAFETTVKDKAINPDEVSGYQQRVNATLIRLDKFMDQFWSDDFQQSNAAELYQQFAKMNRAQRDNFLTTKTAVVPREPVLAPVAVSSVGLFKQPLTAEDKRRLMYDMAGLKRTPRVLSHPTMKP